MPTYEYQCLHCGKTFEVFQKITEDPVKVCQVCGKDGVRRLISPTAFHLKGSGWYKTDYSSGSSGGQTSSKEKKSDTSTETTKPSEEKAAEKSTDSTSTKDSSNNP